MKNTDKIILKEIGEKLAEEAKPSFQEIQENLSKLSNEELEILVDITKIFEKAGSVANMSDDELERYKELCKKLKEYGTI